MKDFLHLLAFEIRRMRILLILWSFLQLFLLYQTFHRLEPESSHPWRDLGQLLYFPWLIGLSLMLTAGQSPAHPESSLRLRPVSPKMITRARISLLFLGILLPALVSYLIFRAWVSLEFSSFLAGAQLIFVCLFPLALFAAAIGNRQKTLSDAVLLFLFCGLAGMLVFGASQLFRITLPVQDAAWISFWWTSFIALILSVLLLRDWSQKDLGKTSFSSTRRRFAVLFLLLFLLFVFHFKNDPVDYGHPPRNLVVRAEDLEVRVTPRQKSYYAVRGTEGGSSTYTNPIPKAEIQPGSSWYFHGEVEVRGLPPGIGFVARATESEWTPDGGEPIPASFQDQNLKQNIFSHRLPPPLFTTSQLQELLSASIETGKTTTHLSQCPIFAANLETYERFGSMTGQLRARIRLDLYEFEVIQRLHFLEEPSSYRVPGGQRILSYTASAPSAETLEQELIFLRPNRMPREPVGAHWGSSLQIAAVDTRTGKPLWRRSTGGGHSGNFIPGFGRRTLQSVYELDAFTSNKDLPLPDPDFTETVFITPVYRGSLHVEVTVDDVRLLPEIHEGERR